MGEKAFHPGLIAHGRVKAGPSPGPGALKRNKQGIRGIPMHLFK
jgi:hypothetical protein